MNSSTIIRKKQIKVIITEYHTYLVTERINTNSLFKMMTMEVDSDVA